MGSRPFAGRQGVAIDGAHAVVVPEVAGRPAGRVDLDDLPPQQGGLRGEGARKPWTAAVCSMCLTSWRPLLPVTLRHSKGPSGSSSAMLHRLLVTPTEVRSRRASRERPRSVRASRRPGVPEAGREKTALLCVVGASSLSEKHGSRVVWGYNRCSSAAWSR